MSFEFNQFNELQAEKKRERILTQYKVDVR